MLLEGRNYFIVQNNFKAKASLQGGLEGLALQTKKPSCFEEGFQFYFITYKRQATSPCEKIFFVPFVCFIICFIAVANVKMKVYYAKKNVDQ